MRLWLNGALLTMKSRDLIVQANSLGSQCVPTLDGSELFLVQTSACCSGPMRFEYNAESRKWVNTRDGTTALLPLLCGELEQKCGVNVQGL